MGALQTTTWASSAINNFWIVWRRSGVLVLPHSKGTLVKLMKLWNPLRMPWKLLSLPEKFLVNLKTLHPSCKFPKCTQKSPALPFSSFFLFIFLFISVRFSCVKLYVSFPCPPPSSFRIGNRSYVSGIGNEAHFYETVSWWDET